MITREKTRTVYVGTVPVGGANPVVIESMTNTDTRNANQTVAQIHRLVDAGCEIIRVAVPDMAAARALRKIKRAISIPLIADIHFDAKLAVAAAENGADKLRINPGNIGEPERVAEVAAAAKAAGIPIRVGVNGGSLSAGTLAKHGGVTARGLAESAIEGVQMLEHCGFDNIVVSVKVTDVPLMLAANEIIARRVDYPLHIGLTEAGTVRAGALRSAAGLGAMLHMGLGSTIRVSLAGDPLEEIIAARYILEAMGLRRFGVRVIACPTCGRTGFDVAALAEKIEARFSQVNAPLTVAVMGCEVNGPGEAREADIGLAAGKGGAVLFAAGQIIRRVALADAENELIKEVENAVEQFKQFKV